MESLPNGLRIFARLRAARQAMRGSGPKSALQALVLGPEHFRAFLDMPGVEPMLLFPQETAETSALGRAFTHLSDIYAHLPTLYRITVEGPRPRVLELGTRSGQSTLALLLAAKEIGGHVTSVDINPCPEAESRVAEAGLSALWTFVLEGDLELDWNDPIDHLFIDTSHRYEHTLEELRKFEPFVVSDGVISVHDTTARPPVWRAIEEHFRGRRDVRIFRYYHNNGLAVIEKGVAPHG